MTPLNGYLKRIIVNITESPEPEWKTSGLDGYEWESLTFLWRDEYHNGPKLAENLPFRG